MLSSIVAFLIKLFTGWALVDFCRGVIVNLFSTLITGGVRKVLALRKNKEDEYEQLQQYVYKAISKHVANKDIARYMASHDEQKFLSALREELITSEHTFEPGTNDADILETLQRELVKKPFFALQLIKLYGKEIIRSTDQFIEKTNETIREIKKIREQSESIKMAVESIAQKTGYTLNITDSITGVFECPIPNVVFRRDRMVGDVRRILDAKGAVYIYGGFKTGKSILSCLVAQSYTDYEKVRIPLGYKNILSIKDIVDRYEYSKKLLFVIDGIPYRDESVIIDLCQYVASHNPNCRKFILNGRQPLSQFTTNDTGVEEMEVLSLETSDFEQLLPDQPKPIIVALSSLSCGNPMIAVLMIQMLETKGWPPTTDALYTLFNFNKNATLNDKFRSILNQIIPNRDAVRLLNRLLLIKKTFTRDMSRALANIDPVVAMPDSCLDDLKNVAIIEMGNGEYDINPSFAKTLIPDLLQQERFNCNHWLADQVIAKKQLDEMDVVRVMNYLLDSGEYDRVAFFYMSCILSLGADVRKTTFLPGIWIDLPLPKEMDASNRILIRIIQVNLFGANSETECFYPARDLENLLEEYKGEPALRKFAYQVLYFYYGSLGYVDKGLRYMGIAREIPVSSELSPILEESQWVALYHVKTIEELYAWLESYAKSGYPKYEFMEEMTNRAVSNIYSNSGDVAESILLEIRNCVEEKYPELWTFAISSEANLLFCYGRTQDYKKAETLYRNSKYLTSEFGKLMLNFSMGMVYYNNNRKQESAVYFKQAMDVQNISLSGINCLYSYVYYAAVISEINPEEAVIALERLLHHPDFEKCYMEQERCLLYGELGMAYWRIGRQRESVSFMLMIEHYLWSMRNHMEDAQKTLLMKLCVMASAYYYEEYKKMNVADGFAKPTPAMFILDSNDILQYYNQSRRLATSFYLYELQKSYLWSDNFNMILFDHTLEIYRGDVAREHPEFVTLFINSIPELLLNGRMDDALYVVLQSAVAVKQFPDVINHPEGAVMIVPLFYLLLYRLDCIITGREFDESSLLSLLTDFKATHPDDNRFTSYLLDVMEGKGTYDVHHSEDASIQSLLVFYHLPEEERTQQWFVALQRLYMSLKSMNKSNGCGKFVEVVTTDMIKYAIAQRPQDFNMDKSERVIDGLKKFELYGRARAVMQAFYFLMKDAPKLPREIMDMMEL